MQIEGRNVNQVFARAWNQIHKYGQKEESRNGPVLSFQEPVILRMVVPEERILTLPERRINPYFALAECVWMLAGSDKVDWLAMFNPRMRDYSDDGERLTGSAYGYRWRNHFGYDQLLSAIDQLANDPSTRRVVLSHWDPRNDLGNTSSKDLPCNLQIALRVRDEAYLDMTVFNRSNDLVYGALGANSCHFSFLLEFLATQTGYSVGNMYQISNNLHVYLDNPVYERIHKAHGEVLRVPSDLSYLQTVPMRGCFNRLSKDAEAMVQIDDLKDLLKHKFRTSYFNRLVKPVMQSFFLWKLGSKDCRNFGISTDVDWAFQVQQFLDGTKLFREE